jgi:hypothetical protein
VLLVDTLIFNQKLAQPDTISLDDANKTMLGMIQIGIGFKNIRNGKDSSLLAYFGTGSQVKKLDPEVLGGKVKRLNLPGKLVQASSPGKAAQPAAEIGGTGE